MPVDYAKRDEKEVIELLIEKVADEMAYLRNFRPDTSKRTLRLLDCVYTILWIAKEES